uniref:Rab11 family-interacting protein 2 n=1 Tax=Plectus sambesii TaxID=2011161 RepID=A0A914VU29_9BILA
MSAKAPNHLLLTVVAARNLHTKSGHGKIEAFVTSKLERTDGTDSRTEKVNTDVKRCSGSPCWEQTCEFSFTSLDCTLSLTVNHRTMFGTSECLGQLQFALKDVQDAGDDLPERWYPLMGRKKVDDDKYRGELLLRMQLSHKAHLAQTLPPSRLPVSKSSLKKKMGFGLRNGSGAMSPNVSVIEERRLSVPDVYQVGLLSKSMSSLTQLPKFSVHKSATMSPDYSHFFPSPSMLTDDSLDEIFEDKPDASESTTLLSPCSPKAPLSNDAKDIGHAPDTRRSSQSSGFESARSAALHLVSADWTNIELVYDTLTKEDLVELIKEQRVRLAQKERRIRDLEEYVDGLIARVLDARPDLLQAAPLHPLQRIRL